MLSNYILVALRSLRKRKSTAAINVVGLALGIAGCLLVGLFVRNELSYDRFHTNADRLYRAWVNEETRPGQGFFNTVTPYVLGPTLVATYPEVEAVVRIRPVEGGVQRGTETLPEEMILADSAFFRAFSFPLLAGDPATALARPDGIVLTDSAAHRYFGEADPLGQPLTVRAGDTDFDLTVTGVVATPPRTSSLDFSAILPFALTNTLNDPRALQSWFIVTPETYVLLREGTDAAALEAKFPAMLKTAIPADYEGTYAVGLQPLLDIHLNAEMPEGWASVMDPQYLVILSAVALLVLLIACINFTTLAVGRSVERTREVGVRKALGAQRLQLMGQFWGEAVLLTALAFAAGFGLAAAALPHFNDLAGRTLTLGFDLGMGLLALGLVAVVALGAGSYPAVVLSRARTTEVLRGRLRLGTGGRPQRALVALQFALSIALLASTLVMAQQLRYLQDKNLGFEPDRVVTIPNVAPFNPEGFAQLAPMLAALRGESAVADVSVSAFALGGWAEFGYTDPDGQYRTFRANAVGADFLDAMRIRPVAGRGFDASEAAASQQAIVNEAFVAAYELDDPVGRPLPAPYDVYTIAGVTEDFHFESLREAVEPLVLVVDPRPLMEASENVMFGSSPAYDLVVRLGAGPLPAAMEAVEAVFNRIAPDRPFDIAFLDDALQQQYEAEQQLGEIVRVATGLAVLIACLGLFGLAALVTVQRTKEIGVRKVLGASVLNLVVLLSKDFAWLVGIAFVVATPVAYVLMGRWLEAFAYRVNLDVWVFFGAGLAALALALLTVSVHAVRAASADPVESLRYE